MISTAGTLLELLDAVRGEAEAILKFRHHDKIFAMDREAPATERVRRAD